MDAGDPDPTATSVLDPIQVREFDDLPSSERLGLLALFDQQSAQMLETLLSSHRLGDVDAVLVSAHSLAGASAVIGAGRLTRLCRTLERAVTTADVDAAESVIGALPQARSDLLRALARHHQPGPPPPAGCPAP
jgi:HPt (histidine-containing phosphotransfer) domain-containing protein